jgi:DNA-directed RNA polymerase specialized sigma24 family protein
MDHLDGSLSVCSSVLPIEIHLESLVAAETIAASGLRAREADMLAAHVVGYSYGEIAAARRTTTRTVERQLLRASGKLRKARARA